MKKVPLVVVFLVFFTLLFSSGATALVEGGGSSGTMNGLTCNFSTSGFYTQWYGHWYQCRWVFSNNYAGWSWVYLY